MLFHCTVWKACRGNVIVGYINKIDLISFDHSTCCVNDPMYHYPEKSVSYKFFSILQKINRDKSTASVRTQNKDVLKILY